MSKLKQIPLTCSGHTRPVVHLDFSDITDDGIFLISACKDGKPMLRKGDTGDWVGTFTGTLKGAVWGVALNEQATRAATGAADFTAKVWDARTGEELHTFAHQHIVKCVDFSSDSEYLLSGSNEKLLRLYDLNQPESEPVTFVGHTSSIKNALFLPNNRQLVSASDDKTVRLWDRKSCIEVKKIDFSSPPTSLEVSKDGQLLLVTHDHTVSFYDLETWEVIHEYRVPTLVHSASLHPNKEVFVCGGEDFTLHKFDFKDGNEIESSKGHFGPVHCVRFSPDGEVYASGSEDGTLRLWQTVAGKTYGLWKCVEPGESFGTISASVATTTVTPSPIKAES